MKINENLEMTLKPNGMLIVYNGNAFFIPREDTNSRWAKLFDNYKNLRAMPQDARATAQLDQEFYAIVGEFTLNIDTPTERTAPNTKALLRKLIEFFSEFQFEPNFRFVNSMALALHIKQAEAREYITNYFALTDNPYKQEIAEKVKSAEFRQLLNDLATIPAPTNAINKRFKIYYGSQGTGKTTQAMQETNQKCMVCNSSMLPADLMEDFVFVDGKATFQPSALWLAMTNGTKITLDEINLLPFDSLRFLQTILDGKQEFLYKGNTVQIADGFQIIGTMNLCVNGMVYGLPEPLIDRAAEMRQFKLTAENLLAALA